MSTEVLLGCPFCGSSVILQEDEAWVECDDCAATAETRAAWNRRAPDSALSVLREALENLVNRIEEVCSSDEYMSVWMVHQLHAGEYRGPTYEKEFNDAKAVLSGAPAPDPKVSALVEALKPFAAIEPKSNLENDVIVVSFGDDYDTEKIKWTVADFRRARTALQAIEGERK